MPLDPDRCRIWVKAIGQEDLVYLPIEKLHQLKFVCNEHFEPEHFNALKTRLLNHAVPTLNLPSKQLEDDLFRDFPQHIGQYTKHDVCVLQDITNMDKEKPKTGPIKRKHAIDESAAVPGSSHDDISLQSHKRKRKNTESSDSKTDLNQEEKLLQRLKAQKLTIRKLAKSSLDLDKIDNSVLKNLVCDVAKNYKKKPSGKRWTRKTKLMGFGNFQAVT